MDPACLLWVARSVFPKDYGCHWSTGARNSLPRVPSATLGRGLVHQRVPRRPSSSPRSSSSPPSTSGQAELGPGRQGSTAGPAPKGDNTSSSVTMETGC
ncbi:unnamed protein product [Boreogadus saida]